MYVAKKSKHNPIFIPDRDSYWESFATFNMCPIKVGDEYYGLYRAISSEDHLRDPRRISTVGIARSADGTHFEDRDSFIAPTETWEKFGCEDPRVTYFEGEYYIFYTALGNYPFSKDGIKVACARSKDLKTVDSKHLVTPFNAKAMTLFPERIGGKITVLFTAHSDSPPALTSIAQVDTIEELFDETFWNTWHENINTHTISLARNETDHTEIGAPPIKTDRGWLLVYSHIQNYFHSGENLDTVFGIEAVLLDLNDLTKIIGRTRGPIVVPSEQYELAGFVGNVVFPSGAIIKDDNLEIFYGAADTTVCKATVNLDDLLSTMHPDTADRFGFKRASENPIISPIQDHPWEQKATFNPASIYLGGKIHILYRTFSNDNTSYIGYASTRDGIHIDERLPDPIYVPRESFELKKIDNANSGCEDPRITQIGTTIYICYTAFDGIGPPKVAISSISEKDFLSKNWNWSKPIIITPEGFDEKDTCIFPEKVDDGYFILHRLNNEICGDYFKSLDFKTETVKKCIRIIGPRTNTWDSLKVGIASPPMKTKDGWLLLYHGVSKSHKTYRVGAVLLDLNDPGIVLARSTDPLFEPIEDYEKVGIVNNVVFPCGMAEKDGTLFIYYGGADTVTGVATIELDLLLQSLTRNQED